MLLGIDQLGLIAFSRTISTDRPPVKPPKYWNEVCKTNNTWTEIDKQEADIARCSDAT